MRSLGQSNFNVALNLHELTLRFCERHFRKLARHVSNRSPEGVGNFLHIALAIGGVLESQIERALTGLEAREHVVPDDWGRFRSICDAYFAKSISRTHKAYVGVAYLSKMMCDYPAKRIREAFEPELQPLTDLGHRMLQFRDRVEALRLSKCLGAGGQQSKPYSYFQSVFSEQRWPHYSGSLQTIQSLIFDTVKGNTSSEGVHARG